MVALGVLRVLRDPPWLLIPRNPRSRFRKSAMLLCKLGQLQPRIRLQFAFQGPVLILHPLNLVQIFGQQNKSLRI